MGFLTQVPMCDTFGSLPMIVSAPSSRSVRSHLFLCYAAGEFFVPNIKSSKKDLRKSRAAAVRNRAQRSALRSAVKKAKTVGANDEVQVSAVSLLDRSARKGLIHRNTAARQKSQIARLAAKSA